tara:strand:- start:424 stop:654 length:231 start_codon:yes stop_codon:yes gene_type:complete
VGCPIGKKTTVGRPLLKWQQGLSGVTRPQGVKDQSWWALAILYGVHGHPLPYGGKGDSNMQIGLETMHVMNIHATM